MTRNDWNETAYGLAQYVRQFRFLVERGVVPLQFNDEEANSLSDTESPLVVGAFGNDNEQRNLAELEVELVRRQVHDAALEELGFAESDDGSTWAMLIGAGISPYQTAIGREFQKELLKSGLEDALWDAWQKVNN